ncbi:MurR/RpiR family transcriptional regulator [Vagococcus hydrophili]|uniref:MurR/RpiR family transcriptional regulator n=1 Tax=Vagococcus hydrophili TaxID=2714947 RepID=A0A6G8AT65_9ENTE|nr:MurR/RpiR family transcriptional regulator [Vagococcus hydrophili]QIL48125.1 MurR/RpiR family transcriptional regulator [Vagococcus hydrophili]
MLFDIEKLRQATETDLQIARYITEHEESVAFMRVRELAEKTHVSPATVIRFTQKMGYGSFPELRLALKHDLKRRDQSVYGNESNPYLATTQLPDDFNQKIIELAKRLEKASFIHCLGTGSSGTMADYAQQRFASLGFRSISSISSFIPYLATKMNQTNDEASEVCLLFSVSGETPDLVHIVKALADTSIYSVSITNKEANTLATSADFSLSYDSPSNRQSYSVDMSSQLPVVYIIETLAKELYLKKHSTEEAD